MPEDLLRKLKQKPFFKISLSDLRNIRLIPTVIQALKEIRTVKGDKGDSIKGDKGESVKGDIGESGENGQTPLKGTDYFTPTEVLAFLKTVTPKKGVDYFDGIDGLPGVDGDLGASIKGEKGDRGHAGKDGVGKIGERGERGLEGISGTNGSDGKTPTKTELTKLIKPLIPESDPFLLGTKTVDETKMLSDSVLTYDEPTDTLKYKILMQPKQIGGGGMSTQGGPVEEGAVLFGGEGGKIAHDVDNFYWDDENDRLSIGGQETEMTVGGVTKGHVFTTHSQGGQNAFDITFHRHSASSGAFLAGARSRGSEASEKIVRENDNLLDIYAFGFDGTDYEFSSGIQFEVDGEPGDNDMPGRMIFLTTPDGSGTLAEAMRINSSQDVSFANMTSGSILFAGTSGTLSQDNSNLFWDDTNKKLKAGAAKLGEWVIDDWLVLHQKDLNETTSYALVQSPIGGTVINSASGQSVVIQSGGSNALVTVKSAQTVFNNLVGINENAPGAMLQINTNGTTVKGQIIKLSPSQTANAFEVQDSSGTVLAHVNEDGEFANDKGSLENQNVFFGTLTGTSTANTRNIGFGYNVLSSAVNTFNNIAVGVDTLKSISGVGATSNIGMGYLTLNTLSSGSSNVAIGNTAGSNRAGMDSSTLVGDGANTNNTGIDDVVCIGKQSTATEANQFVSGSSSFPINTIYFGKGVINATPTAYTINGTGGSGTDIAGANIVIAGGKGTGNALGGDILFQTSDAGVSGTTLQSLTTKMVVTEDGNVGIGTTTPSTELEVNGDITITGRILGAKGSDVASATDITLGDGNYFDITGTTQIDTIVSTDWTAGSIITLQFDASVTVKHNTSGTGASMLLAGSVDFNATANDTLGFVYDGTTWRELYRTAI